MEQNYNKKGKVVETEEAKKTEEVKPPKNGTIITPDGSKEVWVDGIRVMKMLPNGTTESYKRDGKLDFKILPNKKKIYYDKDGKPKTS